MRGRQKIGGAVTAICVRLSEGRLISFFLLLSFFVSSIFPLSIFAKLPDRASESGSSSLLCQVALRQPLPKRPPLQSQHTDHTCGPACLLSWLRHQGIHDYSERDLKQILQTNPREGTSVSHFLNGLHEMNIHAFFEEKLSKKDIKKYLKAGMGMIANVQLDGEGHWVLIVGLTEGDDVVLMDPWQAHKRYRVLKYKSFVKDWYGYESGALAYQSALVLYPVEASAIKLKKEIL